MIHKTKALAAALVLLAQGVANVLAIRAKWAEKKKPLAQPGAYYDSSFYEQALGR